jgi:kinesin family protein 1
LYHTIEIARGAVGLIRMDGDQTIISRPPDQRTGKESEDVKAFTFDKSYWSADKNDPRYADQETVYNDMGEELLDHAFGGYNCCIFACKY